MDKTVDLDDDNYWESSAQKGYSFDDVDRQTSIGDSRLSTLMRKDDLNQFDLLKSEGFAEVVDNRSAKENLQFQGSQSEKARHSLKLAQSLDLKLVNQKKQTGSVLYSPEETVKNMILGFEYSLTKFKGKKEKLALLDSAVKSHDGNAILEIVLFMRETLKRSIFQREIVKYPDAVNVYLAYLEEDHETDELSNMLLLLDKPEDAAILKYEAAVKSQHPERKLKWIENCLSTHFQLDVTDSFLRQSLVEHKQVLEEQIKLENNQVLPGDVQNKILKCFEKLTGKKSVIDSPVLCSLIYHCLLYYSCGKNDKMFPSPEKIKSIYNLSKKQYTWAVLRALVTTERWSDIDDLFTSKNWLGNTKMRSCIAYSRILEVLFKGKAPTEVLKKYVSCVDDEEDRLLLAKKYACHSIVIEALKNSKDRVALEQYRASLPPDAPDLANATDILRNPAIRWKN